MMTEEEYLSQDRYFSESAGEFIEIESMPYQHAYYAFAKLVRQFPGSTPTVGFLHTRLGQRFYWYLVPSHDEVREALEKFGRVAVMPDILHGRDAHAARQKIYSQAKHLGKKVRTHWNGKWVEGEVVTPKVTIRVKGQEVVSG